MTHKQKNVLIQIIISTLLIALVVFLSIFIMGPYTLSPHKAMKLAITVMFSMALWEVIFILIRARQRFFSESEIDGQPPLEGSSSDIQNRILNNTTEQLLIAIPILLFTAVMGVPANAILIVLLGLFFSIGRLLFWIGYHHMPTMRGFGFVLSCYPAVFLYIYAIVSLCAGRTHA